MVRASGNPPVHHRISASMMHNSRLFLRRAAEEIATHDDIGDKAFDADRATLVIVLIQTSVELTAIASIIRSDGLAGVMRKDVPATEEEAETRWQSGDIRTRQFEDLKLRASEIFGDTDFWALVDELQILRNKLVHFHRPLAEADLFDLKYETTHVLIQMILTAAEVDAFELPEGSASFLGQPLFDKLMSLAPYRDRVSQLARRMDPKTFECIMCDIEAYSPDVDKCLACGFEYQGDFLECPTCDRKAIFYDHLNLPFNDVLSGRCGACGSHCDIAHCPTCSIDYVAKEGRRTKCPWIEDHEFIATSPKAAEHLL